METVKLLQQVTVSIDGVKHAASIHTGTKHVRVTLARAQLCSIKDSHVVVQPSALSVSFPEGLRAY